LCNDGAGEDSGENGETHLDGFGGILRERDVGIWVERCRLMLKSSVLELFKEWTTEVKTVPVQVDAEEQCVGVV